MAGISYRWFIWGLLVCGLLPCRAGQHWMGIGQRVVTWTGGQMADRVRLGVRDEGVYRVAAEEIAAAAGVTAAAAREALGSCGLTLTNQGRPVAWTTDGDALYFYGVPTQELFAPENVYWLGFGAGLPMDVSDATPPEGGATNSWFMHAESYRSAFLAPHESRDRRSSGGTLTNVLNFGEWVPTSAVEATRSKSQIITLPQFAEGADTGLVVRLSVASYQNKAEFEKIYVDNHSCEVWLNGTNCGARSWLGEQAPIFDYEVTRGVVTNGPVKLTIRNGLSTSDISDFMLLDATLFYPHRYCAVAGLLLCAGGASHAVSADGFVSDRIGVWDITGTDSPVILEAPVSPGTNGSWQVAFVCGGASARYAVFDAAGGCFEPSVSGVRDTDWYAPGVMPELAIVIPPRRWVSGFDAAVQPLADFRNAQGLTTRVIDAEELYNAFSGGLVHPGAFQKFSSAGVTNGTAQKLRYLLFAGNGGTDYKLEVFKLGEVTPYPTLFPLYLLPQTEVSDSAALMLPNDPVLGDAVGGATPEVAVGRFIAVNAEELTCMVNKTIRYELTETWKNKAVFAADWQNVGDMYVDFPGIASNTASGFPLAGWWLESFYPAADQSALGVLWKDTYHGTGVYYELQKGAGFFYFIGHTSETIAGNTGNNQLFNATMVKSGDWTFAPVALLMGCRVGKWMNLDLINQAQGISEAGVRNRSSGFTAVISAGGYILPTDAAAFSYAFRDQVAAGALRLGDVWRGAFAALGDGFSARVQHMTLLGDPSLCIRADQTARGTPVAWLIAQGLTNNPYADLSDQDGDGFETWKEYQAGTSPLQGGVRIRSLAVPGPSVTGVPLAFEPVAGLSYRVMSTTNLVSGCWEPLPWRAQGAVPWSFSAVLGDWPLKTVEVPYNSEEPQRFYKVESY